MAIRDYVFPNNFKSSSVANTRDFAPITLNAALNARTVSIASGKAKPVRKSKAAKRPASCGWYESEDRNLPSVSSF